jgi:hypothetical protein
MKKTRDVATLIEGQFVTASEGIMSPSMTLREHYAGLAMQGLVTGNPSAHLGLGQLAADNAAAAAVIMADALISALEAMADDNNG